MAALLMNERFPRFEIPLELVTDNGPENVHGDSACFENLKYNTHNNLTL